MDGSKIKNIIIVVLLLVNLFLLALVLHDRVEEAALQKQARADVEAAFENSGIRLAADVNWNDTLSIRSLSRDLSKENAMAKAVLGTCMVEDLGGNIIYYQGAKGEARFRGTGEFEIVPATRAIPVSGSPLDTAKGVLSDMGYRTDVSSAVIERSEGATSVTLTCMAQGKNVYNCTITFVFTPDYLLMVDGRRPLEQTAEGEASAVSAATMLMRFLADVRERGTVCSEVLSVELGYSMAASASGEGSLTPYWHIVTDAGRYYANAMTGKIESVV